jgi:hypothetical protein
MPAGKIPDPIADIQLWRIIPEKSTESWLSGLPVAQTACPALSGIGHPVRHGFVAEGVFKA